MAGTPESKVKKQVRKVLDAQTLMYYNMPVPTGFGEPMLDFVGCHRGDCFMIETKAIGGQLTPRQEFVKSKVEAAGGVVFVIGQSVVHLNAHRSIPSGMRELMAWLKRYD